MDLFEKVGVEATPFMTELNENLRVAHEQGFGPTEEEVRRFAEYQREVTVLETKWDALVRKFKEGLLVTVTWVGKGVDWFLDISTAGDDEREHREEIQALQDAAQIKAAGGYGASMSISGHRKEVADLSLACFFSGLFIASGGYRLQNTEVKAFPVGSVYPRSVVAVQRHALDALTRRA